MPKCNVALAMMVKNEAKYAVRSLTSVEHFIDTFIIYDTGSTDDTVKEIREWCAARKKKLVLFEGKFVNFSVSRNELLRRANAEATEPFLLLLDANDEVRGEWRTFQAAVDHPEIQAGLIKQIWKHGTLETVYWNIRFIKNEPGWYYKGAVHEYLTHDENRVAIPLDEKVYIYQDRNDDGGKSAARLIKDHEMLLASVQENPDNPRDTFYLARTCDALGRAAEAIIYYQRRATQGDFEEEIFWSYRGSARNNVKLGNKYIGEYYYKRAAEISRRAEPLNELADYYSRQKLYFSAYLYARESCKLSFPEKDILFIDKADYDYKRWRELAIAAYYCGHFEEGKRAAELAYAGSGSDIDLNNLKFYANK